MQNFCKSHLCRVRSLLRQRELSAYILVRMDSLPSLGDMSIRCSSPISLTPHLHLIVNRKPCPVLELKFLLEVSDKARALVDNVIMHNYPTLTWRQQWHWSSVREVDTRSREVPAESALYLGTRILSISSMKLLHPRTLCILSPRVQEVAG